MGRQAESRSIVGHLLNVSKPFSKRNPVWGLICNGVEELTEEFNPDTDTTQYICENTKTTILKGYDISFDIDMKYQTDNKVQNFYNILLRTMPTGSDTECEYIRFNKDETMFNTNNQFIGVRRDSSIYLESIGGSGDDALECKMSVHGSGDGEIGYVTVSNTGTIVSYTWTPAPTEIPYVNTIGGISMAGYYSGVTAELTDSKLQIKGSGGVPGATVTAEFETGVTVTDNSVTVGADGSWTIDVSGLTEGNLYNLAFKQTQGSVDSVTTKLFRIKAGGTD